MSSHSDPLLVNGHRFDAFVVIPNVDANAGFSVLMTYALNGVRNALARNWLPVINFDKSTTRFFHDPRLGDNIWDYFWEPVMGVTYDELQRMMAEGKVSTDSVHQFDRYEITYWHLRDPQRIGTFWLSDQPADPAAWMLKKRTLGRRFVADYIRVKPAIVNKARAYEQEHFGSHFRFGVHIRGTDLFYAEPTGPDDYFRAIEQQVEPRNFKDYRVFLATDQEQFVELFYKQYGGRLLTYQSIRSNNDIAPFKRTDVSHYKKGEDVMVDIFLLAGCDHVLKCAASVGEYALWFNPHLDCTDFSLCSSHDARSYILSESAFQKLNLGLESPLMRRLRRVRRMLENFIEQLVFGFDPRAWRNPALAAMYLFQFSFKIATKIGRRVFGNRRSK